MCVVGEGEGGRREGGGGGEKKKGEEEGKCVGKEQ